MRIESNFIKTKNNVVLQVVGLLLFSYSGFAQKANITTRIDAQRITVGDRAKLFIEIQNDSTAGNLQWAAIPDSFNKLEIVQKNKIDTTRQGAIITYKQKLEITGFDSGSYKIPSFQFAVIPKTGTPYMLQSDSFQLLVQTVSVDTTKAFKGIKEIISVKTTWLDYLLYIIIILVSIGLISFVIAYFIKNKKVKMPEKANGKKETITERYLRYLNELDEKKLWQNNQVKEYYVTLTEILRNYIEERFNTKALELTTDEILENAKMHKEMNRYYDELAQMLHTADLAKFAKAEPTSQEHTDTLEFTKQFIVVTKPVIIETTKPQ